MSVFLRLSSEAEPVEFITLGDLAKRCGRSKDALKDLIERGIMPDSNFRTKSLVVEKEGDNFGKPILGRRLYSKEYIVPKLVEYFKKNIKQGKLITVQQRSELATIFEEELKHFNI